MVISAGMQDGAGWMMSQGILGNAITSRFGPGRDGRARGPELRLSNAEHGSRSMHRRKTVLGPLVLHGWADIGGIILWDKNGDYRSTHLTEYAGMLEIGGGNNEGL